MSLGLHYLLLCYSSGLVIHNVEKQSELWNRRPLVQISFPHSLHLTSVNSRTEQGLLKCFCSSWNLTLEMAKSQGRGRCSACSEIRSCREALWAELSLWKKSCQAPNTPKVTGLLISLTPNFAIPILPYLPPAWTPPIARTSLAGWGWGTGTCAASRLLFQAALLPMPRVTPGCSYRENCPSPCHGKRSRYCWWCCISISNIKSQGIWVQGT